MQTVEQAGVIEPVVVTPRTILAATTWSPARAASSAVEAGWTQVAATIRAIDPETGGPDLAMIKNLVREDLSPVDEAHGSQRLLDPA